MKMKKSKLRFIIAVILVISMLFQQFSAAAEGIITVDPQTGLASQYNYLQFDAGTAGTLYVNQYTTKPHVRRSDLTLGGNRMPVEIEFWYDEENLSNDLTAAANPYGYGWMTGYNQLLEYQSLNEKYAWRNANGTWIYFEDSGLRNARLNFRQLEENHIMENIIYNELRIRGYRVDVGTVEQFGKNSENKTTRRQLEVDFVASRGSEKLYIQSAFAMTSPEKQIQEERPLNAIGDSFRKIIVVRDNIKVVVSDDAICFPFRKMSA